MQDAWNGNKEAGFYKPYSRLRVIAELYPNFLHIVARKDANIKTIEDLKNKAVSVGAMKSGTELNARALFKSAGLSYDDLARLEYLPFSESVDLMKNGQIDAMIQSSGKGAASIRDLAAHTEIVLVPVEKDIIAKMGDSYSAGYFPPQTYKGQEQKVSAVNIKNFLVTTKTVSHALAYDMTRLFFENLDILKNTHHAAKEVKGVKICPVSAIPYHEGALQFYSEVTGKLCSNNTINIK